MMTDGQMNEAVIQALRGKYPAEGEVGRRVSRLGGPPKAQGQHMRNMLALACLTSLLHSKSKPKKLVSLQDH